jgi:excisionase family DNA binding protein
MSAPAPAARPKAATYTTREVAALLQCSVKHVQRLTRNGTIPGAARFGRLVRYSQEVIDRWLAGEGAGARRPDPDDRRQ